MENEVKIYTVHHEIYGETLVPATSEGEAITGAAMVWGVPWTKIAFWCDVRVDAHRQRQDTYLDGKNPAAEAGR